MSKKFVLFLLCVLPFVCCAQCDMEIKKERKIYLWDVTLSMQGHGGDDIWNKVKNQLISDIKKITDPSTEIWIVPFQHKVIDKKCVIGSADGKNEIIEYIKNYQLPRLWIGNEKTGHEAGKGENGNTTMTKLYAPLQECIATIINQDKTNILVFMTDGKSDFADDQRAFEEYINNDWCDEALNKDIYAFYLMLTQKATETNIEKVCERFKPVYPTDETAITTILITPVSNISYNVEKDYGKEIYIKFDTKTSSNIKDGFKVHVESEDNPYLEINQDVEFDSHECSINIKPHLLLARENIRAELLNGGTNIIKIKFKACDGMDSVYDRISINGCTDVDLVCGKERKVTIKWD